MLPSQIEPAVFVTLLLSAIIFLPSLGALVLCFMPGHRQTAVKQFSLAVTIVVFLLTFYVAIPANSERRPHHLLLNLPNRNRQRYFLLVPKQLHYYFLGTD